MAKKPRKSTAPRTRHDALFKRIFNNPKYAADELRAVLPAEVARHIDWSTLSLDHANLLGASFKQYYGDLLFSAGLVKRSANAGRGRARSSPRLFIWSLFEHQSTIDHWLAMRMADMKLALWHRFRENNPRAKRLPAVLSVVFYQGPKRWSAARSLVELIDLPGDVRDDFRAYLPSCQFILDDLSTVSDEGSRGARHASVSQARSGRIQARRQPQCRPTPGSIRLRDPDASGHRARLGSLRDPLALYLVRQPTSGRHRPGRGSRAIYRTKDPKSHAELR